MREADAGLEVRVPVKAGPRVVGASFVRKMWAPEGIPQPRQRGRVLRADEIYASNAREIFVCQPQRGADTAEGESVRDADPVAAGPRACRPVTEREVQMLLGFFRTGRNDGGSFDAGIQLALERLLIDPSFLLRIHRVPPGWRQDKRIASAT